MNNHITNREYFAGQLLNAWFSNKEILNAVINKGFGEKSQRQICDEIAMIADIMFESMTERARERYKEVNQN